MEKYEEIIALITPYGALKNQEKRIKQEIEVLFYEETGVKGVRYDKENSQSHNQKLVNEKRLDMIEDKESLELKLKVVQNKINEIETILNIIPKDVRYAILRIYAKYPRKKSYRQVAKTLNYTVPGLQYRIRKELNSIHI